MLGFDRRVHGRKKIFAALLPVENLVLLFWIKILLNNTQSACPSAHIMHELSLFPTHTHVKTLRNTYGPTDSTCHKTIHDLAAKQDTWFLRHSRHVWVKFPIFSAGTAAHRFRYPIQANGYWQAIFSSLIKNSPISLDDHPWIHKALPVSFRRSGNHDSGSQGAEITSLLCSCQSVSVYSVLRQAQLQLQH